jgi:hypothetical protein
MRLRARRALLDKGVAKGEVAAQLRGGERPPRHPAL